MVQEDFMGSMFYASFSKPNSKQEWLFRKSAVKRTYCNSGRIPDGWTPSPAAYSSSSPWPSIVVSSSSILIGWTLLPYSRQLIEYIQVSTAENCFMEN
jgi:hypothetical protein